MPHTARRTQTVCPPPSHAAGGRPADAEIFTTALTSLWHLSNTSRLTTLSESVCRGRAVARTMGRERHRVNWTRALTGVRAPTPRDSVTTQAPLSTAQYGSLHTRNVQLRKVPGSLKTWPDALQVSCQTAFRHFGINARLASRQRLGLDSRVAALLDRRRHPLPGGLSSDNRDGRTSNCCTD